MDCRREAPPSKSSPYIEERQARLWPPGRRRRGSAADQPDRPWRPQPSIQSITPKRMPESIEPSFQSPFLVGRPVRACAGGPAVLSAETAVDVLARIPAAGANVAERVVLATGIAAGRRTVSAPPKNKVPRPGESAPLKGKVRGPRVGVSAPIHNRAPNAPAEIVPLPGIGGSPRLSSISRSARTAPGIGCGPSRAPDALPSNSDGPPCASFADLHIKFY
jgi:hypothetical protein